MAPTARGLPREGGTLLTATLIDKMQPVPCQSLADQAIGS